VAAVAGETIGVGIFLTPAGMARLLGSPFWLLFVWLVMGLMAVAGALCYGGLAARYPEAGGGYVYLREAYGPRVAFLYGWMQLLVLDPGLTASLAIGTAAYTSAIVHLSRRTEQIVAIIAILLIAGLNMRQTRLGAGFLEAVTWLKLAALGVLVIWALGFRLGTWSHLTPFFAQRSGSTSLLPALAGSCVAAFYSFGGWWDASKLAGEVRDPEHTMPRALTIGVVAVMLVYMLVSCVFLYLVPFERITSDQTFMAQAGERLFGPAGGVIMSALVAVCVLGSMAALLILSPRVYYAMAQDGLFFRSVAETHPRYGTPARAITVQAILASVIVLLGTFSQIVAYFVFVAVIFIGLTVAGLIRLQRHASQSAPLRVPGYPYTMCAFVTQILLLLFLVAVRNPWQAFLGVVIVLLGVPAYRFVKK
jgi:APA family basic amino acid/polyamine antiporter